MSTASLESVGVYAAIRRAIEERRAYLDTFCGREVVTGFDPREALAFVGEGWTRRTYHTCYDRIQVVATAAEAISCPTLLPSPWTRETVEALKAGDRLQSTGGTMFGRARLDAAWSEPKAVVRIYARGLDVHGKAYVCGYTEFGPNATLSFSITEGEGRYRPAATDTGAR